ncbi:metal-dependent hydrolase [Candidatus Micrarchaeota archaeon]|nr:metal-dependent hydrolase [Candidatus Micrarchaeota archaeon]
MRGKVHVLITGFFGSAALFALMEIQALSILFAMFAFFGLILGTLLPDVDAPNSKIFHFRVRWKGVDVTGELFPLIGLLTKHAFYNPLAFVLKKQGAEKKHRGFMHSMQAVILVGAFWIAVGAGIAQWGNGWIWFGGWLAFVGGVVIGYWMHLWQDALTITGVRLFRNVRVRGIIRTGYKGFRVWQRDSFALLFFSVFAIAMFLATILVSGKVGLLIAASSIPISFGIFGSQ